MFLGIEMPFTAKEKTFCALEYVWVESNDTAQRAFVS